MVDEATRTGYIRCADGGTIYMSKKPELPRCANYPVQRAALSIMARAIIRHKNSLDEQRSAGKQRLTRMISTIHDALIDEAATTDTKRCLAIMRTDMTLGYTDVFPGAPLDNLVEGGAGPNWAELG
jgi:DNA polymerase I-like protein with 3'-5' exonuclease and polymerase domains